MYLDFNIFINVSFYVSVPRANYCINKKPPAGYSKALCSLGDQYLYS